jgi:hypothetical protein
MSDEHPSFDAMRPRPDDVPGASPSPNSAPAPGAPPRRARLWFIVATGALLLALGIWLVASKLPGFLTRSEGVPATAPPASTSGAPGGDARRIQATLFYVAADGISLVPVTRDVLFGATPAEQARRIVEAQVQTPEGLQSAIPAGTIVRAVFLTENHEAYVDLGGTIRSGHSGGSLDEALAVYAIVNAVTANLPDVTGVQILIDGSEVDSLAGHLDLRFPLGKALEWVQKGQ